MSATNTPITAIVKMIGSHGLDPELGVSDTPLFYRILHLS